MTTRDKLVHAVTEWDRKQSTRRGYNPYALGIYLQRVDEVCEDIAKGNPVREALLAGFNDRLLTVVLKAVGERDFTAAESAATPITYR